jgi:FkbM family methyltransferase
MTLEQLLTEAPAAARSREQTALPAEAGASLVLFGAGRLGRNVLAALGRHGVVPVAFADNQVELWHRRIDGVEVLPPAEAAARFGSEATFVVTIFRGLGDEGMQAREHLLRELGCRRVMSFLPLAWSYADDLLPYYGAALPSTILESAAELGDLAGAWGDAESRRVFSAQLRWRLRGDFSGMGPPASDQYFPRDLFTRRRDDVLVDAGAYDGDTLRAFGPNFARAWAVEPDPRNAARLRAMGDDRITVMECALGEGPAEAWFAAKGGVDSALSCAGDTPVRVESLDRLLPTERPTLLKLDIEGAEQAALRGARGLLARARPLVAACVYHRPDDLWQIPLFLREHLPDHRLFLRAHQNDGYELVAYAIPPERL